MAGPGRRPAGPRSAQPRIALTTEGRWLGLTAVLWVVLGALLEAPGIAAFGAVLLSFFAVAQAAAVIARYRVQRIAVRVAGGVGEPGAVKLWEHRALEIELALVLPVRTPIYALELVPSTSEALAARVLERPADPAARPGEPVSPASVAGEVAFGLELRGVRLGDSWLQGFDVSAKVALGLFAVRAFAPCLLRATVLPRHFASGQPPIRPTRAASDAEADLVHREKRGFGMEIRELRDFQAGDPFKHIAWSASARRGKLIAREFESDLQLSIWLLVDVSASMFWGPPGDAKIDHAQRIAADLARSLANGRDRVGLVLHDHEPRVIVEPGRGASHLARLMGALLEAVHLVHEDRTELTDIELALRVARWFEVHERRTFYLPPAPGIAPGFAPPQPSPAALAPPSEGPTLGRTSLGERRPVPPREPHPRALRIDEAALARAARDALTRRFVRQRPIVPITAYALEPDRSALRAFARHAGLELPRDPTPRPGGQSHGLEATLQAVLHSHGAAHTGAHTLVSITDFHTADDADALRRVALIARRHRHSLVFLMPTGDRGVLPAGSFVRRSQDARLMSALAEVAELQASDNLRAAQAILRPAGATFVTAAPGDSVARVLSKLRAVA